MHNYVTFALPCRDMLSTVISRYVTETLVTSTQVNDITSIYVEVGRYHSSCGLEFVDSKIEII